MAIRELGPEEWDVFRKIRHEALISDPDAFGETLAVFTARPQGEAQVWFTDYVEREDRGIVVAEVEQSLAGMCGFGISDDVREEGFLWGMYVSPAFRRSGVGRELSSHVLAAMERLSARQVRAQVAAPNNSAIHFYRDLGFRIGEQVGWLRDGSDVPVYAIERDLGSRGGG